MTNKFAISMGAFADPILKQITSQGYEAKASLIASWQGDSDAVCRLRIRGVLTDTEAHKANKRLFAAISKGVKRVQQ
jgi:hypothetical protein